MFGQRWDESKPLKLKEYFKSQSENDYQKMIRNHLMQKTSLGASFYEEEEDFVRKYSWGYNRLRPHE